MVGTSGSWAARLPELMATARTLLVDLSSTVFGIGAKYICTSPRTTAVVASGAPRNATWTMLILGCCRKISADRKDVLATPAEEKLSAPGFCFARSTNSFSVFAGESGGTIATSGTDANWLTPAKYFTGSKCKLLLIDVAVLCPLEVSISV